MADESERVLLKYEVDRASLSQAVKSVDQVKASLSSVSRETHTLQLSAKQAGQSLARAAEEGQREFQALRQEINRSAQEADSLSRKKISIGGVGSIAGRTGAALHGLGAGGLGDIVSAAADLADLAEAGGEVKRMAGELVPALANVGATGATAGAGVGALAAAVLPVAAVAGAAALAVKAYTDYVQQQAERIEWAKGVLKGDTDERLKNAELIHSASSEALKAENDLNRERLEIIRRDRADREKQLALLAADFESKKLTAPLTELQGMMDVGAAWEGEIARLTEEEQKLTRQIEETTSVLLPQVEAREREEKAIVRVEEVERKREQALTAIAQLEGQVAQIESQAALQRERTEEDRQVRELQQTEDHNERLLAIEAEGQDRLATIRQQGVDKIAQIDSQIGKLNGSIAKLNNEFMSSERKAVEKFTQDLKRLDESANKQRIRRLEDLDDDLLSAEADNDVNRFIAAQKQGDKDLSRMKEDADAQTQARMEQYAEERALADEQRQARIADIQAQMAEQQTMRQQVQLDIRAQFDAEKTRIAESVAAAQDAFDKAQARETAADKLRDDRQQQDLAAQLKAIDDKIKAEAQAAGIINAGHITAATQGAAQVVALYKQAFNSLSINSSGSFGSSKPSGGSSGGLKKKIAFGYGGVADRPTDAVLGERPGWGDVVLPYQKSAGVESALAQYDGKSSYAFTFTGDIDLGGLSRDEFNTGIEMLAGKLVAGVQMAVGGRE